MSLPSPNHTSILSLPPSLRLQIYREAHLCYGRQVILPPPNYMGERFNHWWKDSDWMKKIGLKPSFKLFLVCKTFYSEASAIFYSENRFYLFAEDHTHLELLQHLRPTSIACLTHLVIQLEQTACFGGTRIRAGIAVCRRGSTAASSPRYWEGQHLVMRPDRIYLLAHWQLAVRHIMKHITPGQLKLYLTCDIDNTMIASTVALPLTQGEALAECSIHLSSTKNLVLSHMAKEMALKATRQSDPARQATPFRYLDLPIEIRHKLLLYTDLITPSKEVQWNSVSRFHLPWPNDECRSVGGECDCPDFQNCAYFVHDGCFCQRYHSVSTLRCQCWAPPVPLFLVCKAMRDDAETIFFRNNRFIVIYQDRSYNKLKFESSRNQASWFLQDVPRATHHLRDLEIVFPHFHDGRYDASEAASVDWAKAIEHMQFKCNLPALKLKIFMLDVLRYTKDGNTSRRLSEAETRIIAHIHRRLLQLLRSLMRCGRLFITVTHPDQARLGYSVLEDQIYRPRDEAWADELGKSIFGNDYQRLTQGREGERVSHWLTRHRGSWEDYWCYFDALTDMCCAINN